LSKENFYQPYKFYLHLKGIIEEADGKISEAEETFKTLTAMKTQLSYWITYFNYQFFSTEYANFLFRDGEYQQALIEIDSCLNFNQNYIPALWLQAKVLEKQNNPLKRSIYQKISELYGESSESNYLRSELKKKL
jgi:hypothetical protein